MQDITYKLEDTLYLNITNRCTNACTFCIRYKPHNFHGKYKLWLDYEPTTEEILKAIGDPTQYKEIVFCGYGEPLIRLETLKEVAGKLKSEIRSPIKSGTKSEQGTIIRVDTNGHANLFYDRNILPELKGLVDFMSISLNAESEEAYMKICNPLWGKRSFRAVLDFIKEAKKHIPKIEVTVVDLPQLIDIKKARKLVEGLGVPFRVRSYYEEKYVR